jgi:hypothetical protein
MWNINGLLRRSVFLSMLVMPSSIIYRLDALGAVIQTPVAALVAILATTIIPLSIFLVDGASFMYLSSAQFLAWSAFRAIDSVAWT